MRGAFPPGVDLGTSSLPGTGLGSVVCFAGSGRQWAVIWARSFWLGSGVPVGSLGPRRKGGGGEGERATARLSLEM